MENVILNLTEAQVIKLIVCTEDRISEYKKCAVGPYLTDEVKAKYEGKVREWTELRDILHAQTVEAIRR